jgi:hypothetical protein
MNAEGATPRRPQIGVMAVTTVAGGILLLASILLAGRA